VLAKPAFELTRMRVSLYGQVGVDALNTAVRRIKDLASVQLNDGRQRDVAELSVFTGVPETQSRQIRARRNSILRRPPGFRATRRRKTPTSGGSGNSLSEKPIVDILVVAS